MKRVLILGGGFGGIATAHRLKQKLGDAVHVTLVDRRPFFMVGFRKSWALVGDTTIEAGQKPIESLRRIGVEVKRGTIEKIDPEGKSVVVDGEEIRADVLVVALGAELDPGAMKGFSENAFNVYDPEDIPRAEQALRDFNGGRLVIGVFTGPYKCPPAPYEMALLINEKFKARGVEAEIEVYTPQPMSLPILGEAGCDSLDSRMQAQGIKFFPNHKADAIQPGQVVYGDKRIQYDLLLGIPPHRAPAVVKDATLLGASGWIEIVPHTCETSFHDVYAIGDVTQIMLANKKPLPKAGLFAEQMGETVAERIADRIKGIEPTAKFPGEGGCYLEVGNGQAMLVKGSFLVKPAPEVTLTDASVEHMQSKRLFESQRLEKWFG